jgi:hypothetical protein
VDRQPSTIVEFKDDDLEQVRLPIRPEKQRPARFVISLLDRVAGQRMFDRVDDVVVSDAVLARCGADLHTHLLYYKNVLTLRFSFERRGALLIRRRARAGTRPNRSLAAAASSRDDRVVPAMLVCCECERRSAGTASGWQGYLVDLDDDGRDEVVFFCPGCAAREFGKAPAPGDERGA